MAKFKIDRNLGKEDKKKLVTIEKEELEYIQLVNERLIEENTAFLNEIRELKKQIEELQSRALVNPRKVTNEQVNNIKELRASGLSYRAIAKKVGLSTCTIQRAINGIYDV